LTETLEDLVRRLGGGYRAARKAYELEANGEIKLRDPRPPRAFEEYLARPAYSMWLWTTLGLVLITLGLIWGSESNMALRALRYVAGSIYVLFLPGYSTVEALYPSERDLSPLERLALSIGLSLAVVPLIGLALNYSPWGIRLEPVSLSLAAYIVVLSLIAAYRKYVMISREA
jgi:uncharacterized membrane protein